MKRISLLLLFTFSVLFFGLSCVKAKENYSFSSDNEIQYLATDKDYKKQCNALFGDPTKTGSVAYYLQFILDIIKYAGIILCIFLTIVDFAKALLGDDKDMHKALSKKAFSRLIYAVMLFFLPIIVKVLLTFLDVYGTCSIG